MKIGRNSLCPCGSGKKYKLCCMDKNNVERELNEASELCSCFDAEKITKGLELLNKKYAEGNLTNTENKICLLYLAQGYKNSGEYKKVIETLEKLEPYLNFKDQSESEFLTIIQTRFLYIYALAGLKYLERAASVAEDVLKLLENTQYHLFYSEAVIELGKIYIFLGRLDEADTILTKGIEHLRTNTNAEDYMSEIARLETNLATIKLKSDDEFIQKQAVNKLLECANVKAEYGDAEGITNIFCNLGLYYFEHCRYDYAIAYTRKDVFISRKIGDKRGLASSLGNLAVIYSEMNQFGSSKKILQEVNQIGSILEDEYLLEQNRINTIHIENMAKAAGLNGEKMGPKALCKCGSGKEYKDCCGRVDCEPTSIDFNFSQRTEEIENIVKEFSNFGQKTVELDYILRKLDPENIRIAWTHVQFYGAWFEMEELIDMANLYLASAKNLAEESDNQGNFLDKPLACIMLSCSAAEAFINQVIYFLSKTKELRFLDKENILNDSYEYQRKNELTLKWNFIGNLLLGEKWNINSSEMNEFKLLLQLRNEMVHFKINGFEQVVPKNDQVPEFVKKLSKRVKFNEIPHSWVLRILSPTLAQWSVKVIEDLINHFKDLYNKERINGKLEIKL